MKRLLFIASLCTSALVAMDEMPVAPVQQALVHSDASQPPSFSIHDFINIQEFGKNLFSSFFNDEKKAGQKGESKQRHMIKELINALIGAAKLEGRIITIGKSTGAPITLQLAVICDLARLRSALIDINNYYFEKLAKEQEELALEQQKSPEEEDSSQEDSVKEETDFGFQLARCIKLEVLKKALAKKPDEFTAIKGAVDALKAYSKGTLKGDITQFFSLNILVKFLFGFSLEPYVYLEQVNNVINSSFKKEASSLDGLVSCINPKPILLMLGFPEDTVADAAEMLRGIIKLSYDAAGADNTAIEKMIAVLSIYGNITSVTTDLDALKQELGSLKEADTKIKTLERLVAELQKSTAQLKLQLAEARRQGQGNQGDIVIDMSQGRQRQP